MIIEKNGTVFTVKETPTGWVLATSTDAVDISYNIAKVDCPTFEALKKFVTESDAI